MRGRHAVQATGVIGDGEEVLDRDALSDLVQTRGLTSTIELMAQHRAETLAVLNELFRQVVIEGEAADPAAVSALIDRLRGIGAPSALAQAQRVLLALEPRTQKEGLCGVIATAVAACEHACGYLCLLKAGLEDLTAMGDSEGLAGFGDESRGSFMH